MESQSCAETERLCIILRRGWSIVRRGGSWWRTTFGSPQIAGFGVCSELVLVFDDAATWNTFEAALITAWLRRRKQSHHP